MILVGGFLSKRVKFVALVFPTGSFILAHIPLFFDNSNRNCSQLVADDSAHNNCSCEHCGVPLYSIDSCADFQCWCWNVTRVLRLPLFEVQSVVDVCRTGHRAIGKWFNLDVCRELHGQVDRSSVLIFML